MIKGVRSKYNIHDEAFTTNAAEAVNHMIKSFQNYQATDLPKFIQDWQELIDDQEENFFLASLQQGRYRLKEGFKRYRVDRSDFYRLPENLKKKKRDQLFHATCEEIETVLKEDPWLRADDEIANLIDPLKSSELSKESTCLAAVPVTKALDAAPRISIGCNDIKISLVPESALKIIWSKAQNLLDNPDSIKQRPLLDLQKGEWEHYQVSSSDVKKKGLLYDLMVNVSGRIKCNCLMFKNKEVGVCSHRIALAERLGILEKFLQNLVEENSLETNISDLSLSGVNTKTAGKKGAVPRRLNKGSFHVRPSVQKEVDPTATVTTSRQSNDQHSQIFNQPPSQPLCQPPSQPLCYPLANKIASPGTTVVRPPNQANPVHFQELHPVVTSSSASDPCRNDTRGELWQAQLSRLSGEMQQQQNTFQSQWQKRCITQSRNIPQYGNFHGAFNQNHRYFHQQEQFHGIFTQNQQYILPHAAAQQVPYIPKVCNPSPAGRKMLPKPPPPPSEHPYSVKKKPKNVKVCISGCGIGVENEKYVICRTERDYWPNKNDDGSRSWHLGREQSRYYHLKWQCVRARNEAFFSELLLPIPSSIMDDVREVIELEFGLKL